MNRSRCYQILIVLLFVILSVEFCFGEVVIRVFNDKTGKFEDFVMTPELQKKYDRQEREMRKEMRKEMPKETPETNPPTQTTQPVIIPLQEGPQWQIRGDKPPRGITPIAPYGAPFTPPK